MKRRMALNHIAMIAALMVLSTMVPAIAQVDISALAGRQLYHLKKCGDCHNPGAKEFTAIKTAPDSAKLAAHVETLKLENVLRQDTTPRRQKKTFGEEVAALTAYLKNRAKVDAAPANFATAGFVMTRSACRNCHVINGTGNDNAPKLAGIGAKHDKKWLLDHFINPQAFVKDSVMPSFKDLPKAELEAMADYLLAQK